MNLVRINDTHQFVWMMDEQTTFDLIKFLQERAIKVPYIPNKGLMLKGANIDVEA